MDRTQERREQGEGIDNRHKKLPGSGKILARVVVERCTDNDWHSYEYSRNDSIGLVRGETFGCSYRDGTYFYYRSIQDFPRAPFHFEKRIQIRLKEFLSGFAGSGLLVLLQIPGRNKKCLFTIGRFETKSGRTRWFLFYPIIGQPDLPYPRLDMVVRCFRFHVTNLCKSVGHALGTNLSEKLKRFVILHPVSSVHIPRLQ